MQDGLLQLVLGGAERGDRQGLVVLVMRILQADDFLGDRLQLAFVIGASDVGAGRYQRQREFLRVLGDVGDQRAQTAHEMVMRGLPQRFDIGIARQHHVEGIEQGDQCGHPPQPLGGPLTGENHVARRLQTLRKSGVRFDKRLQRLARPRARVVELGLCLNVSREGADRFAEEHAPVAIVERHAHQQGERRIGNPACGEYRRMPERRQGPYDGRRAEQQRQHRSDAQTDGTPPIARNQAGGEAHSGHQQPQQPGRRGSQDRQDG